MKLLLVLLCLLLCGCSKEAPEIETEVPTAPTLEATEPVSMYDPENPLEAAHNGALKVYPLTMRKVQGIRAVGADLLAFSGYGSTTLTMLTGEELFATATITLDFELNPGDPSLQIADGMLSFYDPGTQETVVLNKELKEVSRFALAETPSGSHILSSDRNTLYYCTSNAIFAWNLETGIHRTVKELSYDDQQLTGLHLNDTVLQCRIQDGETIRTLFLSADTGQLLSQQDGEMALTTIGTQYFASLPVSSMDMLVFGSVEEAPQILYPKDLAADNFYLPQQYAVVTASILADEQIALNYYDLRTGLLQSDLTLGALQNPKSIVSGSGGLVCILVYDPASNCDIIYRWQPSEKGSDTQVYTDIFAAEAFSSADSFDQCKSYALQLGEKYGIEVLIGEDALTVQPWDYTFEAETLSRVLLQELALLDLRLGQYPEVVLEKTAGHFTSLNICLVRQITGTAASGSLDTATGIQFLDGSDAYVVITVGKYSQQALYHELFHVMETHILNESVAFDQWEEVNPEGFEYTFGYGTLQYDPSYLEGQTRAFVDTYSMTFPKEDRARILENAMLPGNAALFESEIMQAKLTKLCEGIRQAYGLRKSADTFLWEQYLQKSLAYAK